MAVSDMRRIAVTVLLLLFLGRPADISSCGPFLPVAIFTQPKGPDDERAFFAGRLGILQPTYERRYLAMAYRMLNGEPLSEAQREAVTDLTKYRVSDADARVNEWMTARKGVPGAGAIAAPDVYKRVNFVAEAPGCGAGAFVTARETLVARMKQAGAGSAEVRDWLQAQDEVFGDCAGLTAIPDAAPAGSSERVLADRAYQIAAAYFYAGMFDEARAKWREIAGDARSPWRAWAPYLIARAYLREGKYKEAETQLRALLADSTEGALYVPARELLDFALAQTDPAAQLLSLSNRLMERNLADAGKTLNDYTFLFDRFVDGFSSDFGPNLTEEQRQSAVTKRWERLHNVAVSSDLTAWIMEYQNRVGNTHDEVMRWRQTKSVAWLIAAADWAAPDSADQRDVMEALGNVPATSPGYATAVFLEARLLTGRKRTREAAAVLDGVLGRADVTRNFDSSTFNALRAERMRVASTFEEFLANAPRTIAFVADDDDLLRAPDPKKEPARSLDADATYVFNQKLPLSLWLRAVHEQAWPAELRTRVAQAGFGRAVVTGAPLDAFAGELAGLKPSYAAGLAPILHRAGGEQRFAAVFWILHHPELEPYVRDGLPRLTADGRLDEYRANWWCGADVAGARQGYGVTSGAIQRLYGGPEMDLRAAFVSRAEEAENSGEQDHLNEAGDAAAFLSAAAAAWTESHPNDERNPEALALAVKSSHFGCGAAARHAAVEHAFRLLHERYPKSKWAQSTPYWY